MKRKIIKDNYGPLDNSIKVLYKWRRDASSDQEKIVIQKALALAFDISYNRPVQDTALQDLAQSIKQLLSGSFNTSLMADIQLLKADAIKYYPQLVERLQLYLTFN